MGTPRKNRRTYSRPRHPWNLVRVTEEKEICKKYGLKNKMELWKAQAVLSRIRQQTKKLMALSGEEIEKQKQELLTKLNRWGIAVEGIDDVLGLSVDSILERRLQSVVFRLGLANTPKQARQFITHNHVFVGDHKVSIPGYIVLAKDEEYIKLLDKLKVEQSVKEKPAEQAS